MVAPSLAGGAACKSDGRYFSWMPKKDRTLKAKPSGEKWIVYIVRCADGSLYTGEKEGRMIPLYHDRHFTFRFADDRIIPRFHLEGIGAGRRVSVSKIDPTTGERLGLLTTATVGDGGWVDLPVPAQEQ